ncbi:hypothetical protein H5410_025703 [Solanum commersonii]|uniref:Uncharacterized protein n=1 Tax=Solanum commersonii TaxID=4109 RepID=A0A9J5YTW6_SOLCO|nr:hypothetical protein H5410_025703 [Solanum commersonii]
MTHSNLNLLDELYFYGLILPSTKVEKPVHSVKNPNSSP